MNKPKRFNKKYYTAEGQVNVQKVCKEVDKIQTHLRGLHNFVLGSEEGMQTFMLLSMKLIDLSEDLKGNVNTDLDGR